VFAACSGGGGIDRPRGGDRPDWGGLEKEEIQEEIEREVRRRVNCKPG